ncbi:unnamed protein product, partial [Phaeothamnion confervicola]
MSLSEVVLSIFILSLALLGLVGAMHFGMTANQHASNITTALSYARQFIEYIRGGNLPFQLGTSSTLPPSSSGINDVANTFVDLNTPIGASTNGLPVDPQFSRNIQCAFVNVTGENTVAPAYAWKANLREVIVTIRWSD